jgi:hypothetical protein
MLIPNPAKKGLRLTWLKRCLAQTMQYMGWLGMFLKRVNANLVEEMLGPDDSVYGLAGHVPEKG